MLDFMITNPKRHILAQNHVFWRILAYRSRGLGCSELQEPPRKRKKRKTEKTSGTVWCAKSRMRGNETPGRIVTNFCTGVGPRRNHLCQLLWLSLMGFERGGSSNFWFLRWLASSPLQHFRTTMRVCDFEPIMRVFVKWDAGKLVFCWLCDIARRTCLARECF